MPLQMYDRVALRRSFPEESLRVGDVATIVDFVDHPAGRPRGCVLERFNALDETLDVVIVPEDAVEPLRADEVLSGLSRARSEVGLAVQRPSVARRP